MKLRNFFFNFSMWSRYVLWTSRSNFNSNTQAILHWRYSQMRAMSWKQSEDRLWKLWVTLYWQRLWWNQNRAEQWPIWMRYMHSLIRIHFSLSYHVGSPPSHACFSCHTRPLAAHVLPLPHTPHAMHIPLPHMPPCHAYLPATHAYHACPQPHLPLTTHTPMDRILDTRLWKHYLPATTVADGNNRTFI